MYIGNETLLLSSVKYYVLVGGKEDKHMVGNMDTFFYERAVQYYAE